jgi:hypothetical protein
MSVFNKLFGRAGNPVEKEVRLDPVVPAAQQAVAPQPQAAPPPVPDVPPPAGSAAGHIAHLRASAIKVAIEYDFAPHIDRAIALLATDTPMNYTKAGQRRNPARAAAHFRDMLTRHSVQAGILHVRDAAEDYGYCGLYVMRVGADGRKLLHFCFSQRIAGMGVETWLYDRLGRPAIETAGEVSADLQNDPVPDWLALALPDFTPADGLFDTIFARGGSDVQSVMPYLAMLGKTVLCDYAGARSAVAAEHSVFARGALQGISQAALDALAPLGFTRADFTTGLTKLPPPGRDFWLLGFSRDAQTSLWRHRSTGVMVPAKMPPPVKLGERESDEDADCRRAMKLNFELGGPIDELTFRANLRAILGAAPAGTRIFILLMNDMNPFPDPDGKLVIEPNRRINDWIAAETAGTANLELVSPTDFASSKGEIGTDNVFDRMVYVRIAQHILTRARAG